MERQLLADCGVKWENISSEAAKEGGPCCCRSRRDTWNVRFASLKSVKGQLSDFEADRRADPTGSVGCQVLFERPNCAQRLLEDSRVPAFHSAIPHNSYSFWDFLRVWWAQRTLSGATGTHTSDIVLLCTSFITFFHILVSKSLFQIMHFDIKEEKTAKNRIDRQTDIVWNQTCVYISCPPSRRTNQTAVSHWQKERREVNDSLRDVVVSPPLSSASTL